MEIVLHKFLIYSSHQHVSLLSGGSVTMLQALLDNILVTKQHFVSNCRPMKNRKMQPMDFRNVFQDLSSHPITGLLDHFDILIEHN